MVLLKKIVSLIIKKSLSFLKESPKKFFALLVTLTVSVIGTLVAPIIQEQYLNFKPADTKDISSESYEPKEDARRIEAMPQTIGHGTADPGQGIKIVGDIQEPAVETPHTKYLIDIPSPHERMCVPDEVVLNFRKGYGKCVNIGGNRENQILFQEYGGKYYGFSPKNGEWYKFFGFANAKFPFTALCIPSSAVDEPRKSVNLSLCE